MKALEKWTKTELILLALTLAFLVCTGVIFALRTAHGGQTDYVVRTGSSASIPEPEDTEEVMPAPEPPTPDHPLDINTADAETLDLLPGIGETLAGRIVAYRAENGPFAETADIMNVEGIGEGIYGDIQELITVGEAAT